MNARRSPRNRELAAIHIGAAQLGLDEPIAAGRCDCGRERTGYHEMLWTVARVHSAKDLDEAGRRAVIEHLRARGFTPPARRARGRPHNIDKSRLMKKIEALLADAQRPWAYADAMCDRMFHVDRVAFLTDVQLQKLVAALATDQRRRARRAGAHP